MYRARFLFCFTAITATYSASALGQTKEASLPNVIVILADDLGIGDLGCYNPDSKIETPNLDRLASQGIRFTDAHSPSAVCTPTRYGLLTGRYAWRTRMRSGVLNGTSRSLIEPGRRTLADMLQSKGYNTACVGKWHLGLGSYDPQKPKLRANYEEPFDAGPHTVGFEEVFIIPASLDMPPYLYINGDRPLEAATAHTEGSQRRWSGGEGFWRAGPIAPSFQIEGVLPTLSLKAVEFIQAQKDESRPFFLYFALNAPHTPWVPNREFRQTSRAGYYGDFVAEVDHYVGKILQAVEDIDRTQETLVFFTSDNGSHWREVDEENYEHLANSHYRGMKADIYESGHRVPFLVSWQQALPKNAQSKALIGLNDIYATVAEIVRYFPLENEAEDSVSFLSSLREPDKKRSPRRSLVHHSLSGMFAFRWGSWKLIEGLGSGGFTEPRKLEAGPGEPDGQLYNLEEDPTESNNLFAEEPELVAMLQALLQKEKDRR